MRKVTQQEIDEATKLHEMWLSHKDKSAEEMLTDIKANGGIEPKRAEFKNADFDNLDFHSANLRESEFINCFFIEANFQEVNF